MNKTMTLILLSVLVTGGFASQSYCDRYTGEAKPLQHSYAAIVVDTVAHGDTMWCEVLDITQYPGEFYSIGFDVDAIAAGTIAGEVLMRQGTEKGNYPVYTSIYSLSAAIDTAFVITTDVKEMRFLQLGVTNTDAADNYEVDFLNINKAQ